MGKTPSVHRLQPTSGDRSRTIHDKMTALIQEAHRQTRGEAGSIARSSAATTGARHAGGGSAMLPEKLQLLLRETHPDRRIADLVLPKDMVRELRELLVEIRETPLLRSHSLEPRHTVLLVGPPGTGKTSLAAALAAELDLPFLTVRYEGLVGSFLGETAGRLQDVVDYASRTPCVLFFDEFDSVGKERSDAQETGEIKRVVSSLLLQMDALPSHCIIVCATNHPELLDRAVWRRFEVRIELPKPGSAELRDWFARTERSFGSIGMSAQQFIAMFKGETFSEIEAITLDARRKVVLSRGEMTPAAAFEGAIARWERRRVVGGGSIDGRGRNRPNSARTGKARADSGPKSEIPEGNLL